MVSQAATTIQVGDSVLARRDGNEVPGVATDVNESEVRVRLAEPYVVETDQPREELWYPREYVTKVLDDSNAVPELPG